MSDTGNDSVQDGGDTTHGDDGVPYADNDGTGVSRFPGGDYKLIVERTDGEKLTASLRESQLTALEKSIEDIRGERET